MTTARWYITQHAVDCYVRTMRWPASDAAWERAEDTLLEICAQASFRKRDRLGRELWRSARRTGMALRWVVDPRPLKANDAVDKRSRVPKSSPQLPRVIWVGFKRPPRALWEPSEITPEGAAARDALGEAAPALDDYEWNVIAAAVVRSITRHGRCV